MRAKRKKNTKQMQEEAGLTQVCGKMPHWFTKHTYHSRELIPNSSLALAHAKKQ